MNIVIDIETIPDQSPNALDRLMDESTKVSCPHKTKKDIGEDLGMEPEDYKFIGAEDFKQMWIDKKGKDAKVEQAKSKWLKTSFDGAYGQICCICFASPNKTMSITNVDEKELLLRFWTELAQVLIGRPPYFIAHNAKFDLPFLYHRSVVNSVDPDMPFNPHGRHGKDYFCTMEAWAGFNGKIGLDRLAGILGEGGKTEGMSGAEVWPEYQKGNIDKISSYCRDDVELTRKIYNRLTFQTRD